MSTTADKRGRLQLREADVNSSVGGGGARGERHPGKKKKKEGGHDFRFETRTSHPCCARERREVTGDTSQKNQRNWDSTQGYRNRACSC